jgi:hypothetical protein
MVRRASSSVNPLWVAAVAAFVLVALAGGWFLFKNISDPYRTLTPLDVSAYLENANSLRGNVYKISATVDTQLAWAPTKGRLYSVAVNGRDDMLAVMIPAEFNSMNIQKGQRYFFKIEVGDKGILRVKDVSKA